VAFKRPVLLFLLPLLLSGRGAELQLTMLGSWGA